MLINSEAHSLAREITSSRTRSALNEALGHVGRAIGFSFFALNHHPREWRPRHSDLRLHNYPAEWAESYERRRAGHSDPIHRASYTCAAGFLWRDVPSIIPMMAHDDLMLSEARDHGIGDGFTVPACIPGETPGSVTFAVANDELLPEEMLLYAEAFGHLAFQTARVIEGSRPLPAKACVADRQLEIVILIGRDKTDYEMSQTLGVKEDTIAKHVRHICERFDAVKRASVPLRAVYTGLVSFPDIFN